MAYHVNGEDKARYFQAHRVSLSRKFRHLCDRIKITAELVEILLKLNPIVSPILLVIKGSNCSLIC